MIASLTSRTIASSTRSSSSVELTAWMIWYRTPQLALVVEARPGTGLDAAGDRHQAAPEGTALRARTRAGQVMRLARVGHGDDARLGDASPPGWNARWMLSHVFWREYVRIAHPSPGKGGCIIRCRPMVCSSTMSAHQQAPYPGPAASRRHERRKRVATDLEGFVGAEGREEKIAEVRRRIDAEGITYIYYQFVSVTGRIMGKGVPATHWESIARKGFQLVYGATANLFVDRHGEYIGYGPEAAELVGMPDAETFVPLPWDPKVARVWCTCFRGREERRTRARS